MVTGVCYPCTTIAQAAEKAKTIGFACEAHKLPWNVKLGKESGIWYCVVVF